MTNIDKEKPALINSAVVNEILISIRKIQKVYNLSDTKMMYLVLSAYKSMAFWSMRREEAREKRESGELESRRQEDGH